MIKNLTNVRGIKCWGAHSGIKSLRRDLAIIYSEVPASAAAVFTQNEVKAAPIVISQEKVKNHKAQAIVINSGNANACTGEDGLEAARLMASTTAECLGIDEDDVLIASTGIIGKPFPTEEILDGIKENCPKLSSKSSAGSFTANAILTTDTFAKEGFVEFAADECEVNMGGIAKGSGMIHPNMATMLAFIVTDIAIEGKLLQECVREAVNNSFNMITVDGDTSTNDMVGVIANGLAGNTMIKKKTDPGYKVFEEKLNELMQHLSRLIVSDGEGASKVIQYEVCNAPDVKSARKICREISDSSLVKTAMFGRDPNWGRIICAAGNAGVPFDYSKVDLFIGDEENSVQMLDKGTPVDFDRNYMKKLLRESQIHVKLDMHNGKSKAIAIGSDLTTDYVLFNSVYTT